MNRKAVELYGSGCELPGVKVGPNVEGTHNGVHELAEVEESKTKGDDEAVQVVPLTLY